MSIRLILWMIEPAHLELELKAQLNTPFSCSPGGQGPEVVALELTVFGFQLEGYWMGTNFDTGDHMGFTETIYSSNDIFSKIVLKTSSCFSKCRRNVQRCERAVIAT